MHIVNDTYHVPTNIRMYVRTNVPTPPALYASALWCRDKKNWVQLEQCYNRHPCQRRRLHHIDHELTKLCTLGVLANRDGTLYKSSAVTQQLESLQVYHQTHHLAKPKISAVTLQHSQNV